MIWCDEKLYDFWVNGDGYYMYPGPDGPISTSRLEGIRDALEDMELLRMVPEVRKPPSWPRNWASSSLL